MSVLSSDRFGALLAMEAYRRSLDLARRKAYVCDGQGFNWTIWEEHFRPLGFVAVLEFVREAELLYLAPALRAADHRADRDGQDVVELVLARALDSRIANNMETLPDRIAHTGPQTLEIPDMGVLGRLRPRIEARCVGPASRAFLS